MNDFISLCKCRRSIRKYSRKLVSEEDVRTIIQCALMSPSAKRYNPWECIIVREREMLDTFSRVKSFGGGMFKTAPIGIVVVVDSTLTDTWQCDGAIFAYNIMLGATDLGLGSCWCHMYGRECAIEGVQTTADQYIKTLLNIPKEKEVLCIISIGYSDDDRKPYDTDKLSYEKIHNERF